MKIKIVVAAITMAAAFWCAPAHADYIMKDAPLGTVGSVTAVSISTSVWTKVPTSSSLSQRGFLLVRDPSTNTSNVICTTSAAAPTTSTNTAEVEIAKGTVWKQPIDGNLNLYCVSLNGSSGAESVHVREYRQ